MPSTLPNRFRTVLPALVVLAGLAGTAAPGAGQLPETVAGTVLGAAGGTVVTLAVITARARTGHYLYAWDDARWELLPMAAGALAGGVLGQRNPDRLWRGVGFGSAGLLLGSLGGAAAGRIVWGDREGAWAGALMGAGVGLAAGALTGLLTWSGPGSTPFTAQIRLPVDP